MSIAKSTIQALRDATNVEKITPSRRKTGPASTARPSCGRAPPIKRTARSAPPNSQCSSENITVADARATPAIDARAPSPRFLFGEKILFSFAVFAQNAQEFSAKLKALNLPDRHKTRRKAILRGIRNRLAMEMIPFLNSERNVTWFVETITIIMEIKTSKTGLPGIGRRRSICTSF